MPVLRLRIDLREEETVKALRAEVAALQAAVETLTARCNKAEYELMFEYQVNDQLVSLCKTAGVRVPRRLFQRPAKHEVQKLDGFGTKTKEG